MGRRRHNPEMALMRLTRPLNVSEGVNMPVEKSVMFRFPDAAVAERMFSGALGPKEGSYFYKRFGHPNGHRLGMMMAAIEDAEAGVVTASGLAAIEGVILHHLKAGDRLVASHRLYGGTHKLLVNRLPRYGITPVLVDITDRNAVEAALAGGSKMLFVESVSNPQLVVAPIPRLAEMAHRSGAILVVDNTFSPLIISPAVLGADVVVHSATKYVSGEGDIIGGIVCGTEQFVAGLAMETLAFSGPTLSSDDAFHLSQRLWHLPLRIRAHSERARAFAVCAAEKGLRAVYPGLASHPQHMLFRNLANLDFGYGGMLGIDFGTTECADAFIKELEYVQFGVHAVSLGYYHSLFCRPAGSTSSELSAEEQERSGVLPGLVRISAGYSLDLDTRLWQLETAIRRWSQKYGT